MDDSNGRNESLDDLERDAERDRAKLAETVEVLRGRLGGDAGGLPGMLSSGARNYAARRRARVIKGAWRRVEEHPLQSVALAAGIAYPTVRIVTKIPAPILLLGAGVALVGRRDADRSEKKNETVIETHAVARPAEPSGVGHPKSEITGTGGTSAAESRVASRDAQDVGSDPFGAASDAVSRAGSRAAEAGRVGGESLLRSIRRNPVAAGGVSLLVGVALAAMLPRTKVEGRAFGETAEDVRRQARSLAAEGIEAGRRAVGAAAAEAESQNLTGPGARAAIRDGVDRVSEAIRDAADDAKAATGGLRQERQV